MINTFCKPRVALYFSRLELVITISLVIGVMSIIIPLIYKGRLHAKVTTCADNQRQLGQWFNAYTDSADGLIPAYEDGWIKKIAKMGNHSVDQNAEPTGVFSCPDQEFIALKEGITAEEYWRGSHFGINQHIASKLKNKFNESFSHWTQLNVKTVRDPALKVLLADASGSNFFKTNGRDPVVAGISLDGRTYIDALPPSPALPFPYLRHYSGTANFLFLDGHVELKESWPVYMQGPGTSGYYFWSGEQIYGIGAK